jgi:hypothetical protein
MQPTRPPTDRRPHPNNPTTHHRPTHPITPAPQKACENKEVVQKYRCTNDMCAAEFRSLDVDKLEINFST